MARYSLRNLLLESTNNSLIQFFRYAIVGGISFAVDAICLYLLERIGLYYLISAIIGFIIGLILNYLLSKRFVFTEKSQSRIKEFIAYASIGAVGLLLTELFLYVFVDFIDLNLILSKIIAAAIVLIWNYAARKFLLYNKKRLPDGLLK